jgi:aminoglycoside phosphotransferase (APT) family kinase protein
VARWTKQYRAAETETIDAVEHLIDWLPAHLPPEATKWPSCTATTASTT